MKRLWIVLMGLLPFGLYANEMKVPFSIPVDFSKEGTVYETDFMAPWNIWGSKVSFNIFVSYEKWYSQQTEEERIIMVSIGFGTRNDKPIPKEEQRYFKLKVTLTPLGWASNDVTIWTHLASKTDFVLEDSKKEYKDGEKIEFIAKVPLYGEGGHAGAKTIMIADLQRLRNYHIRIESLEDVELPKGVTTKFDINRASRKY